MNLAQGRLMSHLARARRKGGIRETMPYSAVKVANEILRLGQEAEPSRLMTPLQLLKLVYIANGWSLALHDQPLVHESAEAWTYGPVIPSLYRAVRQYRASPVDSLISGDYDQQEIASRDLELIAAVFKAYAHLSGPQLSNMTHMPDTPWSSTWASGAGQNQTIRSEKIAEHYKLLAQRNSAK